MTLINITKSEILPMIQHGPWQRDHVRRQFQWLGSNKWRGGLESGTSMQIRWDEILHTQILSGLWGRLTVCWVETWLGWGPYFTRHSTGESLWVITHTERESSLAPTHRSSKYELEGEHSFYQSSKEAKVRSFLVISTRDANAEVLEGKCEGKCVFKI